MAGKLEGRPFHLLATHCQRAPKADVVKYIKSKGVAEDAPNFTVSSFGGHPGVKGNGYVPYYMVFDHTGKLRHHHMCGDYHGGDGLEMIDWVERLLDETPDLYLGKEPYVHLADIAKRVESMKGLGEIAQALEAELDADGDDDERRAEVERLHASLSSWRDRQMASAERRLATQPSEVVDQLEDLAKALDGSRLAASVVARVEALDGSDGLKAAIKIEKALEKAKKKVSKLRVPKALKKLGIESFDLDNPKCREAKRKSLDRTAKKLRDEIEGHEDLPISKAVLDYVNRLEA